MRQKTALPTTDVKFLNPQKLHRTCRNTRFRHEIVPSILAHQRCQTAIRVSPKSRVRRGTPRYLTCSPNSSYVSAFGQNRLSPAIELTRNEEDVVRHIHRTIEMDPGVPWVFVVNNLSTHCSETLVGYVARRERIDEKALGRKGRCPVS